MMQQILNPKDLLPPKKESRKLITTPRLKIKQLNPSFIKLISKYLHELLLDFSIVNGVFMLLQQQEISGFDGWSLENCELLCARWMSKSCRVFVIYFENELDPVGLVLVHKLQESDEKLYLSVFVHPKKRKQGLGTEAAKAIVKSLLFPQHTGHYADKFDIHSTFGDIDQIHSIVEHNELGLGWKMVLEKLGFKKKENLVLEGRDCVGFSISKRQFAALWSYDSDDYY